MEAINKKKSTKKVEKEKRKKIKTTEDIFKIRYYDENIEAYVLENGTYLDIVEKTSKDRHNIMSDESQYDIFLFERFLKIYFQDLKFFTLNFPVNTAIQRKRLNSKKENTYDRVRIKWLERAIRELELQDENVTKREYFIMFFGTSKEMLIENRKKIKNILGTGKNGHVKVISPYKKHLAIKKLNNMNTLISISDAKLKENYEGHREEQGAEIVEKGYIDSSLFSFLQMQGGITFKEPNHIITGDGYIKILHIYELPNTLNDYWLDNIFNIDGTIATMDISTEETKIVKQNIKNSLKEERVREFSATDYLVKFDAHKRQEQLKNMLNELEMMGEIIKKLHFRIYISDRTMKGLEEKTEKVLAHLETEQFKATVSLNEGKSEWTSLYKDYRTQHKDLVCVKPKTLTTSQIAMGDPFCYAHLDDEYGTFLGHTKYNGAVIFDEFAKTANRKHYNGLCVGDMGSGKSTLLKKRFVANATLGNYIRNFDISGEYNKLTKEFGGKIIKCDGVNGMLNPFEILQAGDDDFSSFARHITKVTTWFKCLLPSASDELLNTFQNVLRNFYEVWDLVPSKEANFETRIITSLPSNKYPVLDDLLSFTDEKIEEISKSEFTNLKKEIAKKEILELNEIKKSLLSIEKTYGKIFNGHTSIDNIVDEKIVNFDLSILKDLDKTVFTAQLFNMISLCWDNCISNGSIMKEGYENKDIEFSNVTRFLIIIDEAHRWVNTKMPMILDLLILYLREARKYFAGIFLASQSIRDFMPEGANDLHVDKIKTIFELCQYKFLLKQDSSAMKIINDVFENEVTFSQRSSIPFFQTGECILAISGDKNIPFRIWFSTEYEEPLFSGGA